RSAGRRAAQRFVPALRTGDPQIDLLDRIRFTVLPQLEVVECEIADEEAVLVAGDDLDFHQIGAGAEGGRLRRGGGRRLREQRGTGGEREDHVPGFHAL